MTFVFSVNLVELQHTIRTHYGAEFNASRYLDRFFDLRITLPELNRKNILYYIGEPSIDQKTLITVLDYFNMQIRDCVKLVSVLKLLDSEIRRDEILEIQNTYCLLKNVIIPFAWGLKINDVGKFNRFKSGSDVTPLDDFLLVEKIFKEAEHYLLNIIPDNFEYSAIGGKMSCSPTLPIPPIHQFYNALFSLEFVVNVHKCRIRQQERDFFFRTLALLADNIMLEEKEELEV